MKKPSTTKEKLSVLKDLQKGKIKPVDLMPETTAVWLCEDEMYSTTTKECELCLSGAEFEVHIAKRPKQKNIVLVPVDSGDKPIQEI